MALLLKKSRYEGIRYIMRLICASYIWKMIFCQKERHAPLYGRKPFAIKNLHGWRSGGAVALLAPPEDGAAARPLSRRPDLPAGRPPPADRRGAGASVRKRVPERGWPWPHVRNAFWCPIVPVHQGFRPFRRPGAVARSNTPAVIPAHRGTARRPASTVAGRRPRHPRPLRPALALGRPRPGSRPLDRSTARPCMPRPNPT